MTSLKLTVLPFDGCSVAAATDMLVIVLPIVIKVLYLAAFAIITINYHHENH